MNEIEVINILKRSSDKKIKIKIKSRAYLFSSVFWLLLSHSWPDLNYMCKAKYKTLVNGLIHYVNFPLQQHLAFLKDLFVVFVLFVLVAICISVSLLGNG